MAELSGAGNLAALEVDSEAADTQKQFLLDPWDQVVLALLEAQVDQGASEVVSEAALTVVAAAAASAEASKTEAAMVVVEEVVSATEAALEEVIVVGMVDLTGMARLLRMPQPDQVAEADIAKGGMVAPVPQIEMDLVGMTHVAAVAHMMTGLATVEVMVVVMDHPVEVAATWSR